MRLALTNNNSNSSQASESPGSHSHHLDTTGNSRYAFHHQRSRVIAFPSCSWQAFILSSLLSQFTWGENGCSYSPADCLWWLLETCFQKVHCLPGQLALWWLRNVLSPLTQTHLNLHAEGWPGRHYWFGWEWSPRRVLRRPIPCQNPGPTQPQRGMHTRAAVTDATGQSTATASVTCRVFLPQLESMFR